MSNKKYTIESTKQYFKDQGCELLEEEYESCDTKMKYRCVCKNINYIRFYCFKRGQRCSKCAGREENTYKYVKQYFKDNGCKLLENIYKNMNTPMRYICNCKNISKINFRHFKEGSRCRKCGSNKRKHTFKYVYNYFKENNCKLLEKTYKKNKYPMKYKCSCGDIDLISLSNFQKGQRCHECAIKKRTGENNWKWNPNLTEEERENNKSRCSDFLYVRWRKKIYIKNNYTCQKCFQRGTNLNAHHVESWSTNKELRFKHSNGITFCEDCHKYFHKIYSKRNNNKQQLEEFLTKIVLLAIS